MKTRDVHVSPSKEGWVVREGDSRSGRTYQTKEAAVRGARELARKVGRELVIHNREGRIQESHSYDLREGSRSVKDAPTRGSIGRHEIARAIDKVLKR